MKKSLFAALAAASLLLAGCSSSAPASSTASTGSDSAAETKNTAHVATDDGTEVSATVTKKDGKVTAVEIDETTEDGNSKKELGTDYGMKVKSGIGKEWDEQIKFLEDYLVKNGIDSVKLNSDGYAEDEDVKSGVTINLNNIMKAVDEAAAKEE